MTVFEGMSIGFLAGAIVTLIIVMIGIEWRIEDVERTIKGTHERDSDTRVYVPIRDRDRSSDNGHVKRLGPEEIKDVVNYFRIGASATENQALDQLMEGIKDEREEE